MAKNDKQQELAITVKKEENISEWYTQVIQKADLIEHTRVSGCMVFKPNSYQIWEKITAFFDAKIKKSGVKNAYFPLLIPESLLMKEKDHVEGFSPEVAWVTHTGHSELKERLAIRPTSEAIMYDSYSKWIQSYRDLPLRLNQWCSVVRWEFKHPTPFMRNREFLWQEGHTAFATKEEADAEVLEILGYYADIYEELLAMPVEKGLKSAKEKFAGADYSTTVEPLAPDGKVIQGGTSHMLGQNFAKAFDITFLDKNQKKQHVWQNSWGISTRTIAGMILFHSDNKGLVLPPRVASNKAVIIPLLFKGKEDIVLEKVEELKTILEEFNPIIDDDRKDSPGFKFAKWEIQGIPIRIEIGPRDLESGQVIISIRDSGEKKEVKFENLREVVAKELEEMHERLYNKAKKIQDEITIEVNNFKDFENAIKDNKRCLVPWAESTESEEEIKEKTGSKSSCIPFRFKDKSLKNIK
jgi:prolyl-tRNA synthetase